MIETTLNKIKAHEPCEDGWEKLLTFLDKTEADDEPLPLLTILESNGIQDAIWALKTIEDIDGPVRLFACFCARHSLGIFESEHPDDARPRRAIETAERFARGQATVEELEEAEKAAKAAAWAAAKVAAGAAAWAAAKAAAEAAAWAAAGTAARAAAWKVGAGTVARAAAWKVGAEVEITWAAFTEEFKRLCILGENYVGNNPE